MALDGLRRATPITAGGESHPAPKQFTYTIKAYHIVVNRNEPICNVKRANLQCDDTSNMQRK